MLSLLVFLRLEHMEHRCESALFRKEHEKQLHFQSFPLTLILCVILFYGETDRIPSMDVGCFLRQPLCTVVCISYMSNNVAVISFLVRCREILVVASQYELWISNGYDISKSSSACAISRLFE